MPQPPRFSYFLSDDDHPVHKNLFLWDAAIPSSRNPDSRQIKPAEGTAITYAEYFKAVTEFLSAQSYETVCKAASSILNRKIPSEALKEIRIYLEKHGEFYHPARVVTTVDEKRVVFALNVAVSNVGKEYMEGEYRNLNRLHKIYLFDFIPKVYEYGCVQIDDNRQVRMFLGEWFEGYHEFHVSEKGDHHTSRIAVWDTENGSFFLSKEQATKLYEKATTILTAYYNLETYEQVFSWHHAAGDFVVNMDTAEPRVKLITVRRYERLLKKTDDDIATIANALLLFLLNVSIRMRIDRIDGVGEISWIDDFAMEGILKGFFKGLRLATMKAAIPDTFVDAFKAFLNGIPDKEFFDLFHAIMGRMSALNPDRVVVKSHLKNHINIFLKMMPNSLDS
ncbi:hypothetical protein ACFL2E_03270 [Thermodesulfobacteriota bacterium]